MNSECKVTKIIDMNNTMVNKADKLSIKISVFIKIICFKQNYLVFLSPIGGLFYTEYYQYLLI